MFDPGPRDRDDDSDERYAYWTDGEDDGNLGNFWTKIRDKVIKPVGRVVAAYYTGGASEVAFKAYDMSEAQKKAAAAQKAQMAQLANMGNGFPPQAYPPSMDPRALMAYGTGGVPSAYPPAQAYGAPLSPVTSPVPPSSPSTTQQMPSWLIPAGIGAVALVLVASSGRRR